ncbi:TonB-dependent receptor [Rhodothermus profundi]|uniref:Outer membrane receptor proteins, mostly Fe transport n=1 Tax=Rhodothermus profundi TaxID=633813 RepID=A0A1M6PJC5_9BACT|nr:TonB-dependent receptor [Rhodothermus profundi]SHK08020.1 Outer membrane receptor proteins, mostly Fe transport [Rhodothermus profundi]
MRTVFWGLLLSSLVYGYAWAQDRPFQGRRLPTHIAGQVLDATHQQPIEAATVAVWRTADSTLVTGTVTDAQGRFTIEGLRPGRYYVTVSFIGYQRQVLSSIVLRPPNALRIDLGIIHLKPDTAYLQEVQVTAERAAVEIGIDRIVYNTRDQLVSIGGAAVDVLRSIPSVEVDIEGNISLRGNQNVAILINGRPSALQGEALTRFLEGLPADAIERIEIIPNPSARYEPDGMAGLINIVLRQNRDLGLGGSLTLGIGTLNTYNASGLLTYQRGRLNLTTNYGFRTGERPIEGSRFRENRYTDPLSYLEQLDRGTRGRYAHNLNTTLEYRLSRYQSLGLQTLLSFRGGNSSTRALYQNLDAARTLTSQYERQMSGNRNDLNTDVRLFFRRIVTPSRHEFTAELRYERERDDNEERYLQQLLSREGDPLTLMRREQNDQDEHGSTLSLQLDYMRPLNARLRLEAGYKGDLNVNDYAQTYRVQDNSPQLLTNTFRYTLQRHAAYGILNYDQDWWGVQLGLRIEQAYTAFEQKTLGETYRQRYFNLFPSIFLSFRPTETHQVRLSYSKRIRRPRTWQLNPLSDLRDPLFRRQGNPYLDPEYTHAFEFSYSWLSSSFTLTLTPYYRYTVDVIRWYETLDPASGTSIITFKNLASRNDWGLETIGTFRMGQWLNAHASLNFFRVTTDGSNVDTDFGSDAIGWSTRLNATLQLRPGLSLQFFYFYRAPMDIENGRISSHSMATLAVRQQLLDRRASLSLRISDLFNTMRIQTEREDEQFYQRFYRSWNAQQVFLTFTYTFGRQPQRRDRRWSGNRESDRPQDLEGVFMQQ